MGAPGEIRFARASDGVDIAYLTAGDGSRDLVLIFGFTTHLDLCRDIPWFNEWLRRSSEHFRTIVFDKRGTGLSDRPVGASSIEQRTQDVLAVVDAVGSERASFVGISEGGPMAIVGASMHPERVERMVFYGAMARVRQAADFPDGVPDDVADWFVQTVAQEWGTGAVMGAFFFSHAADPEQTAAQVAKFERNAHAPDGPPGDPGEHRHRCASAAALDLGSHPRDAHDGRPHRLAVARPAQLSFTERGTHTLKGVPDTWDLFAVA